MGGESGQQQQQSKSGGQNTTNNSSKEPASAANSESMASKGPKEAAKEQAEVAGAQKNEDADSKADEESREKMQFYDKVIRGLFNCAESVKRSASSFVNSSDVLNATVINTILNDAIKCFQSQDMLLRISAPLCVVGDIHGQFTDLVHIFNLIGKPPNQRYLFLGDYVDRGLHSIETFILLVTLQLRHPDKLYLLRGNHECQSINKLYGFYDECKKRFSVKLWKKFCEVFEFMPVAAIIDDKIFCAHGGISMHLNKLEQINQITRPCDIPDQGLLCDILWSDPEPNITGYEPNDRGVSYVFGYDRIDHFNKKFQFDLICRAHQIEQEGYAFHCNRQLMTIFSAQNYCGEFNNSASVLLINEDLFCVINKIDKPNHRRMGNIDKVNRRKSLGL